MSDIVVHGGQTMAQAVLPAITSNPERIGAAMSSFIAALPERTAEQP